MTEKYSSSAAVRLNEFLLKSDQTDHFYPLTPDASTREYFRVEWKKTSAIACVYPFDDLGETQFSACLDVTKVFLSANLPVADIFAFDENSRIIIHEDFGDTILRDFLQNSDNDERESFINQAIKLIARIQSATPEAFAQNSVASKLIFDEEKLIWELNFFKTHYFESLRKKPLSESENSALELEFTELSRELENHAKVLTHRDFHAANLMVRNGELKIIDHQDARLGAASYDLVSLLLDRVTEPPNPEWLAEKRAFFLGEREKLGLEKITEKDFLYEFRMQTIQRCLKAIGTFSFQSTFRGKTHFIPFIKPMFEIVLRAAENLEKYPNLQRIISKQISQ